MTDSKDLNQRFDKLEARLDSMVVGSPFSTFQNPSSRSDEIDLKELFSILWQGKWWIIGVTFLFAVVGVAYALSLPNMYKSEGVYAPAQKEGAGGGMPSQFGGLASLAGVSLGGGGSKDIDQALVLITSWPFLEAVIEKHGLASKVMGVEGWNRETGELVWDREVFNPDSNLLGGRNPEGPSSYEVYATFRGFLSVSFDEGVSMLKVSVEYYSPVVAREWVQILVAEINEAFRLRDKAEARKNIEYLQKKISETGIAEMQTVFYGMVESQMKTLMLAEVDEQYLIKQVVEPREPELRSSPRRAVIVCVSVFLGGFISSFFVLVIGFVRRGCNVLSE